MATKPKGAKGYRSTRTRVRLPKNVRDELAYTAGFQGHGDPEAAPLLRNVELWLTMQVEQRRDDEEGPGPAAQARLWRAVEEAAGQLEQALHDVDESSRTSLELRLLVERHRRSSPLLWPLYDALDDGKLDTREITVLRLVAAEMRKDRESRPGGRRPERARDGAIELLAEAFQEDSHDSINDHYGEALLDFVGLALRAAGFHSLKPDKRWQKIPRGFRKPRKPSP